MEIAYVNMRNIGITEVLARLNDTVDLKTVSVKSFGVRFYNASGELRELSIRKYTRGALQAVAGEDKRAKASHNLQAHGLIMLQDIDNNRTIQVRATSIYGFRDYQSEKWLNVYH